MLETGTARKPRTVVRRPVLDRNHPNYDPVRRFVAFPTYTVPEVETIIGWGQDHIRTNLFKPLRIVRKAGKNICRFGYVILNDSGHEREKRNIFFTWMIPYDTLVNFLDGNTVGYAMLEAEERGR